MGPTGAKTKIPETPQPILIVGNKMAIIYLLSVGEALKAAGHTIYFIASVKSDERFAMDRIKKITDHVLFCNDDHQTIDAMRSIDLNSIKSIFVIGSAQLLKTLQNARNNELKNNLHDDVQFTASVYGSMQCMLKGVCAQCLQWQIDPETGKRTKAVYACSWQHQPMEIIDIDHINDRLGQNRTQEILTNLWLEYLFVKHEVEKI
ncbi:MAG: pyridine nucleotide-disulfide oxidoreductase family [uncultured bacterium]|nr:MAG: pyridine nucleotide-disulfide oxidoreductase family [uncultured bacterium]